MYFVLVFLIALTNASVMFPQDTNILAPFVKGVPIAILTVLTEKEDSTVRDQVLCHGGRHSTPYHSRPPICLGMPLWASLCPKHRLPQTCEVFL